MTKNTWEGMDPDDIPGYIMDELYKFFVVDHPRGELISLPDKEALIENLRNAIESKHEEH